MSSSAIACAIPIPSCGDVPRPSSSTSTNESFVERPVNAEHRDGCWQIVRTDNHGAGEHFVGECTQTSFQIVLVGQTTEKRIEQSIARGHQDPESANVGGFTHLKLAYSAGTKHPQQAMIVRRATCRMYVLFPVTAQRSFTNAETSHQTCFTRDHCELESERTTTHFYWPVSYKNRRHLYPLVLG